MSLSREQVEKDSVFHFNNCSCTVDHHAGVKISVSEWTKVKQLEDKSGEKQFLLRRGQMTVKLNMSNRHQFHTPSECGVLAAAGILQVELVEHPQEASTDGKQPA